MKAGYRHLAYLVLTAALVAPVALTTVAVAQDDQHHDDKKSNDQQKRVYDRTHKDYHDWNDNEDRAYHQYAQEQHKTDTDYSKLNRKGQDQYWNWRHDHPDVQDKH
jgi:Ni/Co efflux regulator RcnB